MIACPLDVQPLRLQQPSIHQQRHHARRELASNDELTGPQFSDDPQVNSSPCYAAA